MPNFLRAANLALRGENWTALVRFFSVYPNPIRVLLQELGLISLARAQWVNTPVGPVQVELRGPDDLATISSMFCRGDYLGDPSASVVIDIGANVGVAAAYFLSRNRSQMSLYAYEPAPRNLDVLRRNMAQFASDNIVIFPAAVGIEAGQANFHLENTGKFGGLKDNDRTRGGETTVVDVIAINAILEEVLARHGEIDVLKVDTEGTETELIRAIRPEFWPRIRTLFVDICEAGTIVGVAPPDFAVVERSGVAKLTH